MIPGSSCTRKIPQNNFKRIKYVPGRIHFYETIVFYQYSGTSGDFYRRLLQTCPLSRGPAQGPAGTQAISPTVTLPVASAVDVLVMQKDSVYQTVDVVFGGGNGQVVVSSCNVVFTRSDGTSETKQLKPEKGATVTFQGTKGQTVLK